MVTNWLRASLNDKLVGVTVMNLLIGGRAEWSMGKWVEGEERGRYSLEDGLVKKGGRGTNGRNRTGGGFVER
jgi:hypothetical protein